jgi:hypothetical protein
LSTEIIFLLSRILWSSDNQLSPSIDIMQSAKRRACSFSEDTGEWKIISTITI